MEINLGLILATLINTGILYAILRYFFFGKVKAIIDERERLVHESLDNAEMAREEFAKTTQKNSEIIEQVKYDAKKITENEVKKANQIYEEIVEDAKLEAEKIKNKAKLEIAREKEKAEFELKKQSVSLAVELAEKVIEKNIDEDKNKELIDSFISGLGQ